ncbi:MAG TPA: cytochrome c peroxidase [Bacteroidia bacterium]|nr:cytochrome c peroxidase [Bacteroidia bacterium]
MNICLLLLCWSCRKDSAAVIGTFNGSEAYTAKPYEFNVPKRFPAPAFPDFNRLTVEGVYLGRALYFDPILSTNGRSCSSCHNPQFSFSSPVFVSSSGYRISVPPHINLAWNPDFNWNGSVTVLDRLCLGDFGPEFFNTSMPGLVSKLMKHDRYPLLFKKAFDVNDISALSYDDLQLKIVYAISQFMRSMVSGNSKYDRYLRHEVFLSPDENEGMETFFTERGDCFHCHAYPLMSSNTFHNNGLDSLLSGQNLGRYLVSGNINDEGKFSAPTLRNIEYTAPYMHDGRFQTLEEVVEFYNSGVHWNSPNIDPLMTKPAKLYGLGLSPVQKSNLVKFLRTLSDTAFLNNPAYKKPF